MKKGFKFGIEFECYIPQDYANLIDQAMREFGCGVGSDGTLQGYEPPRFTSREYQSPPLAYNAMYRLIGRVCDLFNKYECHVNNKCGLHLHTSNIRFTSQKYLKRVIHAWVAIEDVLISTQPPSRYNSNAYNRRLLRKYVYDSELQNLPRAKNLLLDKVRNTARSQNLNLTALVEHKTLENRLHAGTTNKDKMRAWLELNRKFYIYCLTEYKPEVVNQLFKTVISEDKIQQVFNLLKVSDKTQKFYQTRIKKYLFDTLAREQESAYKTLELMPAKDKALKRLDKLRSEYQTIERQFDSTSQGLQY